MKPQEKFLFLRTFRETSRADLTLMLISSHILRLHVYFTSSLFKKFCIHLMIEFIKS